MGGVLMMEFLPLLILMAFVSLLLGFFLFLKPASAIELQRRFYEKINWKIEPISIPKEIRNTKLMGLFLIILAFLISAYIFIKR